MPLSEAEPSVAFVHRSLNPSAKDPLSWAILFSRSLVAVGLVAQLIIAAKFWSLTWDDSAITLAFARSLSITGRIEPTPGSGIVEGYSTTLWMLLMAIAAKVIASPAALLAFAKISTLLLNLSNILLMRRWFLTWNSEVLANLIAGSVGCGLMFYETINGMETPLVLTLILVMLLLLPLPEKGMRLSYLVAGSALLLTRWEAVWLLLPFVLVERPVRRALISSSTWLAVFFVSNFLRWRYFGSILPNTVIAKRGIPYSHPIINRHEILMHLQEPAYILASCKQMFLLLIALVLVDRFVRRKRNMIAVGPRSPILRLWQFRFTVIFVIFSLILSAAIGPNWGPPFRSFYAAWPFLFCLALMPITSVFRSKALTAATVVLCLFALLRMSVRVHELNRNDAPIYMPKATIKTVAVMAQVLSDIESASRRSSLLYAGPDMGGVMLFAHGVRVIDLGLLCDPVLAHQRYAAINSYLLQQRRPDVIEVHEVWTKLTNLGAYPLFRSNYRPVYVDGMRVFLTNALIAAIDPSRLEEKQFSPTGRPINAALRDPGSARSQQPDDILNQDFGTYLVLK